MKTTIVTLVKREFWENKSLWIVPVAAAAVLLVLVAAGSMLGAQHIGVDGVNLQREPHMALPPGVRPAAIGVIGLATQLYFAAMLTALFYLLDSLYTERKDRSILFWKSLPVSDAQTVLAKFGVALVIVPLGVFVLSVVLYPVVYAIAALGIPHLATFSGGWSTGDWLVASAGLLASLLVTLLWYAPVAAWAMLASVLSRRSPVLIAALPVVVLAISEGVVLQSAYVWRFVGRRLAPIHDPAAGLLRPDLWIGLAVAAGMLYLVVRLRRYRDDT